MKDEPPAALPGHFFLPGFFRNRKPGQTARINGFHSSALYSVRGKNGPAGAEVTGRARFAAKTRERIYPTPRIEVFGAGCYCASVA
jgi:hypothetical protein